MTNVEALKALATALGVESVNANTIAPIINLIAEQVAEQAKVVPKEIILASSTADSTKKFKITVVDAGTISATEIV